MTALQMPQTQQSPAAPGGGDTHWLPAAGACSLRAAAPMQLRVLQGRAWVTLGQGMGGWLHASGDLLLHAGQSVCVQPGQRAVVEPLDGRVLRYLWRRVPAPQASARQACAPAGACSA
ncbi:hypothetical protein C6568_05145 [Melaminivora suipulveris]|uniref:DUF2917 domain-containing protein n=1 Tax=Melaminivora suipulveris TaxID=2109913 RepID=A0A2R3QGW1_9BURK|nr:DUF2917 domain-containing protein [Melaminivora suipulveris]AVO50962.1 hypothetical protein C6568_05145 [Melaminivora suipulveris]